MTASIGCREELVGELSAGGGITTAEFRDRYHTSRKYAIPLLEYFDRTGLTDQGRRGAHG